MTIEDKSPLHLSDDEVDNFDWESLTDEESKTEIEDKTETEVVEEVETVEETTTDGDATTEVEEESSEEEKEEVKTDESDDVATAEESDEEDVEEVEKVETKVISKDVKTEVKDEEKVKEVVEDVTTEPNYKEEYNKLLAPFKANGKMMQIENVDDAVVLMQKGANYVKKMVTLKPTLKIAKMLEQNNLLDEDKINFLIDLDKQNPDAIKKLIQDSKIDVEEIDTSKKVDYQSKTYNVSDKEVELDGVLETIKDTKSFDTTLNIITNKLDESSKEILVNSPDIIPVINDQVESGIYDQIMSVVDRERALGRLVGFNDLQAYQAVGKDLDAKGVFKPKTNTATVVKSTKTKIVDSKLKDKKKAASSTKSTPGRKAPTIDPLKMSDEEFEKIIQAEYN